jgi:hypothetical protein
VAHEIEPRPPERIGNGQHIADQVLGAVRIDLDRPHARRVAPLVERHRAEPSGGERRQLPEPLPGVLREPVQQQHAPPGDGTGCEPVERAGASRDRDLRSHAGGSSRHARTVPINEITLQSRLCRPEIIQWLNPSEVNAADNSNERIQRRFRG